MEEKISYLRNKVNMSKHKVLDLCVKAGMGHVSSAYSCAEILCVLYYSVMNIRPDEPDYENRDRFIMSKNHASIMQYPILADMGFIKPEELDDFLSPEGSMFGSHSKLAIPGVDFAGGSLGLGIGVAAGIAYAAKSDKKDYKIYCLLGDGELYEGSVWESVMFASHNNLSNLVAIVDRNKLAITDYTENMLRLESIIEKWKAFGWEVISCNGHDIRQLLDVFERAGNRKSDTPLVIIADTEKGKGIDFIEGKLNWHGAAPKKEQVESAYNSLEKEVKSYE